MLVGGVRLAPDPSGALWWPDTGLLVVADLHLEKASAIAARGGGLLPPYDTRRTLARLGAVIQRLRPARVLCLGDSFHDRAGPDRLDAAERATLQALAAEAEWLWLLGNHDPELPAWLPGRRIGELALGPLVFRHEPAAGASGEVCGHLHPKASVEAGGRRVTRRCFVTDGVRLVMPAFGAYAGGLDVRDPAIRGLFMGRMQAWLLGESRVFPVSF